MYEATDNPITQSRRSAMRVGLAAALGALAAPAVATADTGADAELIRLCERLVSIEAGRDVLFETIDDDDVRNIAMRPIDAEWRVIKAAMYKLPDPTTPAGARATARAAVAEWQKNCDGLTVAHSLDEYLALNAAHYLADGV